MGAMSHHLQGSPHALKGCKDMLSDVRGGGGLLVVVRGWGGGGGGECKQSDNVSGWEVG
jgi:hypothetical protein